MQRYMDRIWELMNDAKTMHHPALYDEATPKGISYEQLRILSGRVYAYLKTRNIGREDFVLIRLPRGVQPIIAMIGVWRAGAAFVIAEENLGPERVDYIDRDCGCKLAITSEVWEEIGRCEPLDGYEQTDPHNAAYAVYTSGTTGNPKGVLHEYGNLERCKVSANYQGQEIFEPGERFALAAPLNFVASTMVLSYGLYRGVGCSHILSFSTVKSPVALIKYLLLKRITLFFLTPTYARKFAGKTGPFLKKMVVGSEPANRYYLKGVTNYNMYAQSESGVVTSMFVIDKPYDVCPVGKPQFDLKYRVVDEAGHDVPEGEMGEFIFESPYVRGYINLPEETAKAFKDGYFYTSDLARILPDGNIAICGRKNDMIKIDGNRVEPAEIEAAIQSVLKIDWCAVRGFVDDEHSFLCAYYKDDITFDADELRAQLQKRLPYYMIPAHFMKIDSIPLRPNGKLDRSALPKPELDLARTYKEPTNEVEAALCRAMQIVLGVGRVGIDDDFYEIGGDSLASMEVLDESGLPGLDVSCIFRGRTPAQIAKLYLRQLQSGDPDGDGALNEAAKREEHKLTPEQLDFFRYQSEAPDSVMYNLFELLRFGKAGIDLARMARALEKAIKNHPALCTVLRYNQAGELVQKYDPDMPMVVTPEKITEEELDRIKDTLVSPFRLLNAPLVRCRLFETEAAVYLFIEVHHLVFDGYSFKTVMDNLLNAYLGVPMEPDHYHLTLTRRRQMEQTEFYQESRQYHERTYDTVNWTTYPAFDRKNGENRLGTLSCKETLSPAHIASVEKKFMVSRNEFYIAATLLAMAISTGKQNVRVSWIYNGRDDLASASSVGLLCRELTVGLRLRGKTALRDIFDRTGQQVQKGIQYSCYPYMANKPQTDEGDIACVIYQRDIRRVDDFMGVRVESVDIANPNAAAESVLDLQILDGDEGLQYVFDYDAGRYEAQTMTAFRDLFGRVVAAIVHNANTDGYTFGQLKRDVQGKTSLAQKRKTAFSK